MSKQFTFGKWERLKSRKTIEQLFSEGRRFSVNSVRVFYIFQRTAEPGKTEFPVKCGVSAPAKNFRKAVERNRIRRQLREAWRLQKAQLSDQLKEGGLELNLFLIYTAKELPEYRTIRENVALIIKKLEKLANENITAGT